MNDHRNQRQFSTVTEHLNNHTVGYQNTLLEAKRSANFVAKVQLIWPQLFINNAFQGTESDYCQPAHFQHATLFILCDLAIVQNQLRFHQQLLLDGLHQQGFTHINTLKLSLQQGRNSADLRQTASLHNEVHRSTPSQQTLKSLLNCAQDTNDPALQQSLQKLYQRLKNQ